MIIVIDNLIMIFDLKGTGEMKINTIKTGTNKQGLKIVVSNDGVKGYSVWILKENYNGLWNDLRLPNQNHLLMWLCCSNS